MPIPSTMADLSLTAANNSPQGTDPIGNTLDDYLRSIQAILRSTNALAPASIASASTTDIGSAAAESVEITGTTTITSFGTAPAGIRRELRFTGSLTIVHSSSIQLPGAKNWQTAPGDVLTFRSLGSGQWIMTGHQSLDASRLTGTLDDARLSSNIPRLNAANTFSAVQTVQVSGETPLSVRRVGSSQNVNIEFRHDGATRYLGLDSSGDLRFGDTSNLTSSGVRVSLEGHTHDYVPLVGGSMTGGLGINTHGSQLTMRETDGPDPNDSFLLDLNGGVASLYTHDSSAGVWHQGFSLDVVSGYVVIGSGNYNAATPPVRIRSAHGFVEIGPAAGDSCHFWTDRPRFYFDKEVHLGGSVLANGACIAQGPLGDAPGPQVFMDLQPTTGRFGTFDASAGGWQPTRLIGNPLVLASSQDFTRMTFGDFAADVTPGYAIRFGHAQQYNSEDGKIGVGLYAEGLNIVGVQTVAGQGRRINIWGNIYLNDGARIYDANGTAYLKSNYPSGNVTISTSGPSGGNDGDIWFQVV